MNLLRKIYNRIRRLPELQTQPNLTQGYIQLNRRFVELSDNLIPEDYALRSYTEDILGREYGLGWNDILKQHLVIILGEPGCGKTWELRHQTEEIRGQGQFGFFIQLDSLIHQPFESALSQLDLQQFNYWKNGKKFGAFFLDSVDEAKFQRDSDFYLALDRFRDAIGDSLGRSTIIISSRISEWLPSKDKAEIDRRFGLPLEEKNTSSNDSSSDEKLPNVSRKKVEQRRILILQLEPLTNGQIELFLKNRSIDNPDGFKQALDSNHAWEFVRRPIDVNDFIDYWIRNKSLGSLTELIEYSIEKNLEPSPERKDTLTKEMAREGAEFLAAATAFCRRFVFKIPGDEYASDAINGYDCLPDHWNQDDYRRLMNRPIFDDASYGKIRFHHRRISEYLASKWIEKLISSDMPINELERLLFEIQNGRRILRRALAPIVAWLACGDKQWSNDIRGWILESSPEILFQYGDPSRLSVGFKKELLKALIEKFKGRSDLWINPNPESLWRIADDTLALDVSGILLNKQVSVDIRCLMSELVRHGRLQACYPTLLKLIFSREENARLKIYASAAIRDSGNLSSRRKLYSLSKSLKMMPNDLCSNICEALYPSVISPLEFVEILRKSEPVPEFSAGLNFHVSQHLRAELATTDSQEMLMAFLGLARTIPQIRETNGYTSISAKFWWTGEVIETILQRHLSKAKLTIEESNTAADALLLLADFNRFTHILHYEKIDFGILCKNHPLVRKSYVWLAVKRYQANEKEAVYSYHQLFDHYSVLAPEQLDFDWLLEDVKNEEKIETRQLALRFALMLAQSSEMPRKNRKRLSLAIEDNPQLITLFKKLTKGSIFSPIKGFWNRNFRWKLYNGLWWQHKRITFGHRWRTIKDNYMLLMHLKGLFTGSNISWLGSLCHEAEAGMHDRWTPKNWKNLVKTRGWVIAWAVQTGCEKAWSRNVPNLPYEMPNPNQTPQIAVVGLAGIQVSLNKGHLLLSEVSDAEAELLGKYAIHEMNNFPPWFSDIAKYKPDTVRKVLIGCISAEWNYSDDLKDAAIILRRLAWRNDYLTSLITDNLIELLKQGSPQSQYILSTALAILLRDENCPHETLTTIAQTRLNSYKPGQAEWRVWSLALIQLNAAIGLKSLRVGLMHHKHSRDFGVNYFASLKNDPVERMPVRNNPDYLKPEHLADLILLVFKYVRPSEDISHAGTTYTPGPRDDAQHFRAFVFQQLVNNPSPEADIVLRGFLKEKDMKSHRDYILHVLEERAEKWADLSPWTSSQIKAFANDYQIDPRSDHDLYELTTWRLLDIKHDVEKSDLSIRGDLHPSAKERRLRIWLARQLVQRSNGKFVAPQEVEVDLENKPDIRIEHPNIRGPVPIEIKWAQKWSYNDLFTGLRNQLIQKYLKDENAQYGVYLLGYIGKEKKWRKGHINIGFDQLIQSLQDGANSLQKTNKNINGIKVIGVDFRRPKISKGRIISQ